MREKGRGESKDTRKSTVGGKAVQRGKRIRKLMNLVILYKHHALHVPSYVPEGTRQQGVTFEPQMCSFYKLLLCI